MVWASPQTETISYIRPCAPSEEGDVRDVRRVPVELHRSGPGLRGREGVGADATEVVAGRHQGVGGVAGVHVGAVGGPEIDCTYVTTNRALNKIWGNNVSFSLSSSIKTWYLGAAIAATLFSHLAHSPMVSKERVHLCEAQSSMAPMKSGSVSCSSSAALQ